MTHDEIPGRPPQPRPIQGILVAITVINWTRLAPALVVLTPINPLEFPELREKICFSVQKAPLTDENRNENSALTQYRQAWRQRNLRCQDGLSRELAAVFG